MGDALWYASGDQPMKKVALLFVVAVLAPSAVLAWLAMRSLRDQEYVLQHQQSMLYQGVADAFAKEVNAYLADRQREFALHVESLLADQNPRTIAPFFDDHLLRAWPMAEVGFVVSLDGTVIAPSLLGRSEARRFRLENDSFLSNRETVEVYWNSPKGLINIPQLEEARENFRKNYSPRGEQSQAFQAQQQAAPAQGQAVLANSAPQDTANTLALNQMAGAVTEPSPTMNQQQAQALPPPPVPADANGQNLLRNAFYGGKGQNQMVQRKVLPQNNDTTLDANGLSRMAAAEAEFRQVIGDATEGALARFLQNKLKLLIWYRSPRDPQLVFGAQLSLPRMVTGLREIFESNSHPPASDAASSSIESALPSAASSSPYQHEICVALLDDNGKPTAVSHAGFAADWKRPFVATEIGEILPHWEVAVYLLNPAKLSQSARALRFTMSLFIGLMLLAIGVGAWLIVADLRRELTLARQKTDFVSNVSHELKTPLTSIRMFSELLADGRVADPAKQHNYLAIITAEAARLTRLINNVLDFARIERGEKKYQFRPCDVVGLVAESVETYRPHLEADGFRLVCELPDEPLNTNGDRDALAQIVVNLLSNAEKYCNDHKEITVRAAVRTESLPVIEVKVCDRGLGVPKGCEEKIFEKFFRAHDALASGIQGSGLGLTLARQIARAHGGDITYEPREGGGSCFTLRLPLARQPLEAPGVACAA